MLVCASANRKWATVHGTILLGGRGFLPQEAECLKGPQQSQKLLEKSFSEPFMGLETQKSPRLAGRGGGDQDVLTPLGGRGIHGPVEKKY